MPLITAASDGRQMVVAAADRAALALGIRPAMPLAHARAMVPGLTVVDADLAGDAAALARMAAWCLRYSPLTAGDPPDGVWIDITGCAHLHGCEAALLADLLERLGRSGTQARAAVADTPGAAHAVARFAPEPAAVIAPGAHQAAIAPLPVSALRLPTRRRSRRCQSLPCACRPRPSSRCGDWASTGSANWPKPPGDR